MHILEEKKRSHVAGYVISMWHLEAMIRAYEFNVDRVLETLIPPDVSDAEKELATEVYSGMVSRMEAQGLQKSGHLEEVNECIVELQYLHDSLVGGKQDEDYLKCYELARSGIKDLQQLAENKGISEIMAAFNGIYGVLVLKARNEQVSEGTLEAERHIRAMLDALSERFRAIRSFPDPSLN